MNFVSLPTPASPLLLGGGKLAKHLAHYLDLKALPFVHFPDARNLNADFEEALARASFVWLLVSDQALEPLSRVLRAKNPEMILLHASAATPLEGAFTLHPLQTFGPKLYPLETYEKISFTTISEEWEKLPTGIQDWLSNLKNPVLQIPARSRALYHAACSMTANFPQILWTEIFKLTEEKLKMNAHAFLPLLQQSVENYLAMGSNALTGPLVRGDQATIKKHEEALACSSLSEIYADTVELYENHQRIKT